MSQPFQLIWNKFCEMAKGIKGKFLEYVLSKTNIYNGEKNKKFCVEIEVITVVGRGEPFPRELFIAQLVTRTFS